MNNYNGVEIAIIGMSGQFPGAENVDEFWENLKNGVESISFFTEKEIKEENDPGEILYEPNYVKAYGYLQNKEYFDSGFFGFRPAEAEFMDPQIRLFLENCWKALEDAGCDIKDFTEKIGLYAGGTISIPWLNYSILSNLDKHEDAFTVSHLRDVTLLCARAAYLFNLKGPSVFINTACSTSLVAVQRACMSLLLHECRMALAGGVTIRNHSKKGYLYAEGMIQSKDGHCRAFDAGSNGTVSGEGVGVVVLKRLSDAIADGDNIHAIIRGSGINNDGNQKISFTAPGVDGQTKAIVKALNMANVKPETIGYVEAHATATALGDAIEVEALNNAFGSSREKYCALGSVKTNIGHLDSAAGIAGFIKSVLTLKHKKIPPSLYYQTPNPNINFTDSPFFVNNVLRDWKSDTHPLRAGISSFGIGGTNAHIILEEAPKQEPSSKSRGTQLIMVSAKTPGALERNMRNLGEHIKKNNDVSLPDIAYTLQVGRSHFGYRKIFVCNNIDKAVDWCSEASSDEYLVSIPDKEPYRIVFMFSGQGAQYINMCYDLYRQEEIFRQECDRCFDIVKRVAGKDIRTVIFPDNQQETAKAVNNTEFTQPALFIVEYALAQLLMKWGIQPAMVIGHSFGEYMAACISGVFSLEDALKLVVKRGELMQRAGRGKMMGVSIPEHALQSLLNRCEGVSLATVNSSELCVVSGLDEAIDEFKSLVEQEGHICKILPDSFAYHSAIMDEMLPAFEEAVAGVTLRPQKIPLISNLTGKPALDADILTSQYWVEHLRRTVRFSDGIETLMAKKHTVFVEVGPGVELSVFVRSNKRREKEHKVISLVKHQNSDGDDMHHLLNGIGKLWLLGIEPDWNSFYEKEKRRKVSLPGYAFEKIKYPVIVDALKLMQDSSLNMKKKITEWFYAPTWKKAPAVFTNGTYNNNNCTLLFADQHGIADAVLEKFRQYQERVICVRAGNSFKENSSDDYELDPGSEDGYSMLFKSLANYDIVPGRIIHCWGISDKQPADYKGESFYGFCNLCFYSMVNIVKGAYNHGGILGKEIVLLTNDLHGVLDKKDISPVKAFVLGLLKVISQEYPTVVTSHIDISMSEQMSDLSLNILFEEIRQREAGKVVSLRNSTRWLQMFDKIKFEKNSNDANFKKEGVYLVTGGLGEIGFGLSKYLLSKYNARVILLGRTLLPAKEKWDMLLQQDDVHAAVKERIIKMQELEKEEGQILYISADISNRTDLATALQQSAIQFGRIDGVIHAAGIIKGRSINAMSDLMREDFEYQFASKVHGLVVLHEAFKDLELDFCIVLSSLSTVLGGLGFAAYASANSFMDYYIQSAREQGALKNWISVDFEGFNFKDHSTLENVFEKIVSLKNLPQVVMSMTDLDQRLQYWVNSNHQLQEEKDNDTPEVDNSGLIALNANSMVAAIEKKLLTLWKSFFGKQDIRLADDFLETGGDSLKALIMIGKIHKAFNVEVSVKQFFHNSSVKGLADYIYSVKQENRKEKVYQSIPGAEKREYYPLSAVQQRLYFLYEFDKTSLAYNTPTVLQLAGGVDKEKLNNAFSRLIALHENLRTSFVVINNGPMQKVSGLAEFAIEYYRLSREQVPGFINTFIRPFDLGESPLMRVALVEIAAEEHLLIIDMHHIINDGVSLSVLVKNFMSLYSEEELPALRLHYKDYAVWQQSSKQQREITLQKNFWISEFAEESAILDLPADFTRPAIKSYEGDSFNVELSIEETTALKAIADKENSTLFMVLMAVYNILLSKISNQEDIVVGVPVAGRQHNDLAGVPGMFVNTLPMRNYPAGHLGFTEFLAFVKSKTLACFDNQAYQYEELINELKINRDTSRNPLFDVLFIFQNFGEFELAIPGITLTSYERSNTVSMFDLTLTVISAHERIILNIEYSTRLFKRETIERFISYFREIVSAIIADASQTISDIEFLTPKEKHQLLYAFNDTGHTYPAEETIVSLFEKQVARTPEKIAVIYEDKRLTYRELNEHANQLAHHLRKKFNIQPGDLVAIMADRSEKMITGLLAILKSGAAYVPVDPAYPAERITYILADSMACVLLVSKEPAHDIIYNGAIVDLNDDASYSANVWNPAPVNTSKDLCYLIYTSGSTGKPKGVMIAHYNVVNFFTGLSMRLPINNDDSLLAITSTSFDISVLELFWTLCNGIELVLHPSDISLNTLDRYIPGEDLSMDFSLFFFSSYNNNAENDKYKLLLESVKYADQEGFTAVWTPERHFHEFGGLYPNPSVISSALAMITKQIALRSGSIVSPLHDVLRIAEEWSVVDNLSGGRVGLSFASGWNPNDFVLARESYENRHATMYRQIETVRRLWKGESVTRTNGIGKEVELRVFPKPVQKELPVWITSAGSAETFRSAGASGANILTHFLGQNADMLAANIRLYREARKQAGHDEGKVAIMLHTYIGDSIEQVEEVVEQPFIDYLKSSIGLSKIVLQESGLSESDLPEGVKEQILHSAFKRYYTTGSLIGTKSSCGKIIQQLKDMGVNEIACLIDFGVDAEKVTAGLKKLSELKELYSSRKERVHKPITILQSTPSFLQLLTGDAGSKRMLQSLRLTLIGGEALPVPLVQEIQRNNSGLIYNMFGPTETTIWSTMYGFDINAEKVSIGKPLCNTQVYILNKDLGLLPVGVAGDMYIGGDGVSRGYWNRPELTTERFIPDPFNEGKRIYKTGDVARWMPDGNIEFIGRNDHQVKIRGHRIELGEIESSLLNYESVREVVVLAKDEKQGSGKFLVAYIVAENIIDQAMLRKHLEKNLPSYMVPGHFVQLDKFPLTPNGKTDRKALPDPDLVAGENYIAPRTKEEKLLSEVWSKILGIERVGITDNFFSAGGDSIKSIQIISRMRSVGYELSVKDIFTSQTIKELSVKLKQVTAVSSQSLVTGKATLTPVQQWFFEDSVADKHHYNQSVMLHFPDGLSLAILVNIFSKLQEHHDALRMVFREDAGIMTQENLGPELTVSIEEYDLVNEADPSAAVLLHANRIQGSIDISKGPLMKLGLFHINTGSRLLIVIHHLVIDGISWRIVFEDIERLHGQIKNGQPLSLPLKTESFLSLSKHLAAYTKTKTFKKARAYWRTALQQPYTSIPRDFEGTNIVSDSRCESFQLGKEDTVRLLTEVHKSFNTRINDILLAALLSAVRRLYDIPNVRIDLESHGREDIQQGVNFSRTIGWFTSIYPVLLGIEGDSQEDIIKQVKEILRKVPNNGLDYLLQKYLDLHDRARKAGTGSQICFNYFGQFDSDTSGNTYQVIHNTTGNELSPTGNRDYDWEITGMVVNGQLKMNLTYSKQQYRQEDIRRFMGQYAESLAEIINYCCCYGKKVLTPADVTYPLLTISQLDKLQQAYALKDIYTLSPMQEGLLFHSFADFDSDSYFMQTTYRLKGKLDILAIEKSLHDLTARYDILRTLFLHEGYDRPIQVVLKERNSSFRFIDIRDECLAYTKEEVIQSYRNRDKSSKFDLHNDILMRVTVLQLTDDEFEFVWSYHHILMDGWCMSIVIKEFNELYLKNKDGKELKLPEVNKYAGYIKWLEDRDKEESVNYWKNYLSGYECQAGLPKGAILQEKKLLYSQSIIEFAIPAALIKLLNNICAESGVTLNTILQALWGILLARYNNTNDVVFGSVVSGRPAEIEGIETMVGLFINTVPVRIQFNDEDTATDLLKRVQENAIHSEEHHYHPLAEVQSLSELGRELLDHLMIFENFPVENEINQPNGENNKNKAGFEITGARIFEQTNYPLTIGIFPGETMLVKFTYNANVYATEMIERISQHYQNLLETITSQPKIRISDIDIVTNEEKEKLLKIYNRTAVNYPTGKTITDLFKEQVIRHPGNIAVQIDKQTITYAELDKRSDKVAHLLIENGIRHKDVVGLLMDRSLETIVGMLSILKAGGAYLPIDIDYPKERKEFIIHDSGISKILSTRAYQHDDADNSSIIYIEDANKPDEREFTVETVNRPSDLCYVIYTSGTTGNPKGVMVEHKNVVRLLFNDKFQFDFNADDVWTMFHSHCFDFSVWEMYGALLYGGKLIVIPKIVAIDTAAFLKILKEEKVTVLNQTPSAFNSLIQQELDSRDTSLHIRYVIFAGEALSPGKLTGWRQKYPQVKLINMYGITETTVHVTYKEIGEYEIENNVSNIGAPIPTLSAYIFDRNQKLVPKGMTGELYVGGDGVARGYLRNEELTNKRFIPNPYNAQERLYRSGDLVRALENWEMEYLGRIDDQVQLRGYRIELGEIEHQLLLHEKVSEVVAVARGRDADQYLVAYYVAGQLIDVMELRSHLSGKLPDYMIPSYFVRMENMPLTSNGKINKRALPEPETVFDNEGKMPQNELEKQVLAMWQLVLMRKDIGVNADFFLIGGNSLKLIKLFKLLDDQYPNLIKVRNLFEYRTIESFAGYINNSTTPKLKTEKKNKTILEF